MEELSAIQRELRQSPSVMAPPTENQNESEEKNSKHFLEVCRYSSSRRPPSQSDLTPQKTYNLEGYKPK